MSKLYITDTILRDAHQSQAATRMTTEEMLLQLLCIEQLFSFEVVKIVDIYIKRVPFF